MSNRCLFSNLDKIYVESSKPSALSPRVYYRVEIKGFEYLLMFLTLKNKKEYPTIGFFQDGYLFHQYDPSFDFRSILYYRESRNPISDFALCLIPLEPFISKFGVERVEKYGLDCLIVEENPLESVERQLESFQSSSFFSKSNKDQFFEAGEYLMKTLFSISENTFFVPVFKKRLKVITLLAEIAAKIKFESFSVLNTFIQDIDDQEAFEDYASEEYGVIQGLIENDLLPTDFPTDYYDFIFYMSSGLVDDEVIEKLGSILKSVPKASLEYDFENKQGKRESSYDTHIVDHIAKCINEYISKVIEYLNK